MGEQDEVKVTVFGIQNPNYNQYVNKSVLEMLQEAVKYALK